jgi:O-antigen/teichoic acid export membrane protein
VKRALIGFVERIHFLTFQREISLTMREFILQAGWSFVGVFVSAALFFALNILAGRVLGPEGYGRYNLVIAITASLSVFMAAGYDTASIKFMAQFHEIEKKWAAMSNTLIFVVPFSLIIAGLLFGIRNQLASLLHVEARVIVFALFFTLLFTLKSLLNGFIQGLTRFKYQTIVKIIEAVVATGVFSILFFGVSGPRSYEDYIYALSIGSTVSIVLFFISVRSGIRKWNRDVFMEERSYLRTIQLFTIVGVVLTSADKFFIAHYLGPQELGMYSAYLFSATIIVAQFILVVDNVFFPMVSQVEDKKLMLQNIYRFLKIAFVPSFIFTCSVSYVIIRLFGSQYAVNWLYIIIVSLIAYLQIASSMFVSLIASTEHYFRISTRVNLLKPILIGVLYVIVVTFHQITLPIVLSILALSYIFDIVNITTTFRLAPSTSEIVGTN